MMKEESVEYLAHANNQVRDLDLPSWVPDPSKSGFGKGYTSALYRKFSATGHKRATIHELSEREIVLKGVFIDTVSEIGFMASPLSPQGVSCQ